MLFFNLYFVGLGIERCKACQSEGTFGQGDSANHTMEKNGTQVRIQFESRPASDVLLLLMDAIFFWPSDVGHPFLMFPLTKLLRGPVIGGFIFTICYSNSGRALPKMHALVGTNLLILF